MSGIVEQALSQVLPAALSILGVGDIGTYTLATLPDPSLSDRRTCWCTDLYGVGGRMVSEAGFWKAIRPLVMGSIAAPGSNVTIQPFIGGTTLMVTGNLAVNRNITLGTGSGFAIPHPGYRQRTIRTATGALTSLLVNGVGLSLNGWADHEWDGTQWQQTASGGLL